MEKESKNNQTLPDLTGASNTYWNKNKPFMISGFVVCAIAITFFLWGMLIFYLVGASWPPPWHYGIIDDVPGQSIYAVHGAENKAGTAPLGGEKVRQQHIMGKDGETDTIRDKGDR